jgi:hypothetical protein
MKPIWFFVGILLSVMGAIITVSGVASFMSPPEHAKVLGHLHADLWWGLVMTIAGALFLLMNKNKTV